MLTRRSVNGREIDDGKLKGRIGGHGEPQCRGSKATVDGPLCMPVPRCRPRVCRDRAAVLLDGRHPVSQLWRVFRFLTSGVLPGYHRVPMVCGATEVALTSTRSKTMDKRKSLDVWVVEGGLEEGRGPARGSPPIEDGRKTGPVRLGVGGGEGDRSRHRVGQDADQRIGGLRGSFASLLGVPIGSRHVTYGQGQPDEADESRGRPAWKANRLIVGVGLFQPASTRGEIANSAGRSGSPDEGRSSGHLRIGGAAVGEEPFRRQVVSEPGPKRG